MMNDLISRQAAIDAILAVTGNSSVRELYEHVQEHGLSDMWSGGVSAAIDIIIAVPPVQPDSKELSFTQKKLDTISRQAAIDHLKKRLYETALNNNTEHPYYEEIADNRVDIWLNELPSAQPEVLACGEGELSAQPEQRWIPVDLRNNSPEENKVVLLGVRFQDDFKYFVTSRQDYNYWTGLGREINGELRWQPLPEQYRAERSTDGV